MSETTKVLVTAASDVALAAMALAGTKLRHRRPLAEPVEDDDALMNGRDVAALLRTTPANLYNMRQRAQFPAGTKLPGLGLRWRRADVLAWVAAQQ